MSGKMNQPAKEQFKTSKFICTVLTLLDNSLLPNSLVREILAGTVVTSATCGRGDNFPSEVIFLF